MTDTEIYRACAALVESFAAAQGLRCAFPDVAFDPGQDVAWLNFQWFPNETQNYGMDDDGPSLLQGFAQLSLCRRPGAGIPVASAVTDQIIAAFGKGTTFAGARVYRKPWVNNIIKDPERTMHPVTIMWRGFDS